MTDTAAFLATALSAGAAVAGVLTQPHRDGLPALRMRAEAWTDAGHHRPYRSERRELSPEGPGGLSIAIERGAGLLLVEVDSTGTALVTLVSGPGDGGQVEVYAGRIGG